MDEVLERGGKMHELLLSNQTSWVGFLDNSIPAALWIDSGEIVRTSTLPVAGGKLHPEISLDEALAYRNAFKRQGYSSHTLTGPVGVRDAVPGDSIEIRILKLEPEPYCYTYNPPHGGVLGDEGISPHLSVGAVDAEKGVVHFKNGIDVPLQPMLGVIAVAPEKDGRLNAGLPGAYGGNIDWPDMGAGATLYLPVFKEGALICVGDAHAGQGCGEVCGNSMEVGMRTVELQIILHKGTALSGPHAENKTHWICFGFHPDLAEAARIALRNAIQFLCAGRRLTREDAYHLCSNAIHLRITQLVNGHRGVHAEIPKCLFVRD